MTMNPQRQHTVIRIATFLLFLLTAIPTHAQTSAFTYQGRLEDGGTPANGTYDLQFALFDSLAGGAQVGSTQTVPGLLVSAGIFSVSLDFGASAFSGANRWLEIRARLINTPSFTTLSPRQAITSTPYAIRSLNATSADTVTVNGVPSGSGNYIQNATSPQSNSNFSISGNGTAGGTLGGGVINAGQEFRLSGFRFLSVGNQSTYAGIGAGSGGVHNTFFGTSSGKSNGAGASANTYFGTEAGQSNINSGRNSFFGNGSGFFSTGEENTFVGAFSGSRNETGSFNTLIGSNADVLPGNLSNATALGAQALVEESNALVLGSVAGRNGATASVNVGIGTTTPTVPLHVIGGALFSNSSNREVSIGSPSGESGIAIRGTSNRADVRFDGTTLKLVAAVGIGPPASTSGIAITTAGNVGIGTLAPSAKLDVNGTAVFQGTVRLIQIETGFGEGSIHLCRNPANVIATCNSSSLRYKQQIAPFSRGLDLIRKLRPINFTWKMDGSRDFGLAAEDVAEVEPRLITRNDKGEIDGVKYEHLNVILINAIKQQQEQISRQQKEIESLKKLVCLNRRRTGVCK